MSSNIEIEKTCQWCGKRFIARTTVTAYCSHRCSGLAYKERKRKKKVEQCKEEQKRVQTGQAEIQEKDFLSPRDAAQLLGVCYKTFYNYINNGSIKAWKLKRKTQVRRVDVERLFTTSPERLTVEKEEKAITDFYTTQEVLEKYKLSNGWFWKVAKEQKFPKTVYRGKNLWSKEHVDRFFVMMFGQVVKVGSDKRSGNYVILQHGDFTVSYCHLSKGHVKKGDYVRPRDVVGISGSTGRTTGSHLHLTVRIGRRYGNPGILLQFIDGTRKQALEKLTECIPLC